MRKRALIGCMVHRAAVGGARARTRGWGMRDMGCDCRECGWWDSRGSPSAISMAVMPRDHWSLYGMAEGGGRGGKDEGMHS